MAALQVSEANLNRSESGWSAALVCCQTAALCISVPSPGVDDRFGSFAGPTQRTASPVSALGPRAFEFGQRKNLTRTPVTRRSAPEVLVRWWRQVRYRLGWGAERMPVLRCDRLRLAAPSQ